MKALNIMSHFCLTKKVYLLERHLGLWIRQTVQERLAQRQIRAICLENSALKTARRLATFYRDRTTHPAGHGGTRKGKLVTRNSRLPTPDTRLPTPNPRNLTPDVTDTRHKFNVSYSRQLSNTNMNTKIKRLDKSGRSPNASRLRLVALATDSDATQLANLTAASTTILNTNVCIRVLLHTYTRQ